MYFSFDITIIKGIRNIVTIKTYLFSSIFYNFQQTILSKRCSSIIFCFIASQVVAVNAANQK